MASIAKKSTTSTKKTRSGINDKKLRARVKLFGNLLGNVIKNLAGVHVYDAVEKLRKGYISLRKTDNPKKRAQLMAFIETLDADTLTQVVRAFSIYFSLINIAEEDYNTCSVENRFLTVSLYGRALLTIH